VHLDACTNRLLGRYRPIDAALDGISGPTALHLCFGYAYVARDKPNVYAFLPELTASKV
jgi:5-methyltetrahydropteroyltriglutamate--homocysteine methyltransferase